MRKLAAGQVLKTSAIAALIAAPGCGAHTEGISDSTLAPDASDSASAAAPGADVDAAGAEASGCPAGRLPCPTDTPAAGSPCDPCTGVAVGGTGNCQYYVGCLNGHDTSPQDVTQAICDEQEAGRTWTLVDLGCGP
jgi:hypothetical protein